MSTCLVAHGCVRRICHCAPRSFSSHSLLNYLLISFRIFILLFSSTTTTINYPSCSFSSSPFFRVSYHSSVSFVSFFCFFRIILLFLSYHSSVSFVSFFCFFFSPHFIQHVTITILPYIISPSLSYPIIAYHHHYPIIIITITTIPYHHHYPILSYPILSYPILSYPILSYPILSYPILSYPILSYHIISYHIISPSLSYHITVTTLSYHHNYPIKSPSLPYHITITTLSNHHHYPIISPSLPYHITIIITILSPSLPYHRTTPPYMMYERILLIKEIKQPFI